MQDLSLHVLDVAENCIRAGADLIEIEIAELIESDQLVIVIKDNGCGMEADFLENVLDPFVTTRTTRKVGLGLPLFRQAAVDARGDLAVDSSPGCGTVVRISMSHSHIDRKPMGNMAETILTLIEGNPAVDVIYTHRVGCKEFVLDTRDLRAELEEIPFNSPEVVNFIKSCLNVGINELTLP